jgi:hypothetical protein
MWDPRQSAGSYATLAALLAGSSISGLLWISGEQRQARLSKLVGVKSIWSALVPLVLATLLYGENEGEQLCGRAMVNTTVASTLLTIGTVSVLVALTQLMRDLFDTPLEMLSLLIAWTAIVLGAVSTYLGNDTMLVAFTGSSWELSRASLAQVSALTLAIPLGLWLRRQKKTNFGPHVAVLLGAGGFVAFYLTAFIEGTETWLPKSVAWIRLVVWCCFCIALVAGLPTREGLRLAKKRQSPDPGEIPRPATSAPAGGAAIHPGPIQPELPT